MNKGALGTGFKLIGHKDAISPVGSNRGNESEIDVKENESEGKVIS